MNNRADLEKALRGVLSQHFTMLETQDTDVIVELCLMAAAATGKENPRELLRIASNSLINEIVSRESEIKNNKLIGPIFQLFLLESKFRDGKLAADWIWTWDSLTEGHVSYLDNSQ